MVILEAAACGMCVVSYDCPPGPREIVSNNENGIIVPLNDRIALEETIEGLINDPKRRMNLGKKAKQDVKKYLPSNVFVKWDKLIREVISK